MGRRVRGYEANAVKLTPEAAGALAAAQHDARSRGVSLFVFDGFRPQRAVDHFVEWGADLTDTLNQAVYYPNVPKAELFERGYIAERSGHSRGSTVDLTLTRDGEALDMGTPFDFFDELSHTENPAIADSAMANRMLLRSIMMDAGFRNYVNEWWHYTSSKSPIPIHTSTNPFADPCRSKQGSVENDRPWVGSIVCFQNEARFGGCIRVQTLIRYIPGA